MRQAGVYLAIFVQFCWVDSMHSTGQGGGERKHVLALRKHSEHQQLSLPATGQTNFLPIISESPKMSFEIESYALVTHTHTHTKSRCCNQW